MAETSLETSDFKDLNDKIKFHKYKLANARINVPNLPKLGSDFGLK